MPQQPSSNTTTYLDQPPSCLQFCPSSPNNFVVGTYLLSETKTTDAEGEEAIQQAKTGSLQLWQLDPETNALTQLSRHGINAAVFDLQFHPRSKEQGRNLFAIATSDASVSLFTVSDEAGFTCLWTKTVHEDPSIPALFLAWAPENWIPGHGKRDGFAVTFSDGLTGVFGINDDEDDEHVDEKFTELGTFEAKQPIEVWFVALASYAGDDGYTPYMFTGNDFGSLHTRRFADIQPGQVDKEDAEEDEDTLPSLLINTDDKAAHHTSGVTSILPLPIPLSHALANGEPLLITGSYDEGLRVYHACRGGRGRVIAEAGLGGGVWRLQLLETSTSTEGSGEKWTFLILASCMHGGTRIVRVCLESGGSEGEVEADIEVLAEFTEHESMNYASDVWRPADRNDSGPELRVVSSSFYDRRVCVWRVER
ncbi:hypothetical protein BDV18DRAFT_53260 [Aspergillus unguis]